MATTVAMTEWSAQKTLNFWLNGGTTAVSQPAAKLYIHLMLTAPSDDRGTGYTAVTGVTYTPVQLTPVTVGNPSSLADYQRAFNGSAISINMTGGTTSACVGIVLALTATTPTTSHFLAAATTDAVVYYGTFASSITLNNGDTLTFNVGTNAGLTGITIDQY
jgi:hypothetical protein